MGFSVTEIQPAQAQNSIYPLASGIFIICPSNTTYGPEALVLNASVNVAVGTNIKLFMTYSMDGTENKTLPTRSFTRDNSFLKQILGSTNLPNLTHGTHNITVYAKYTINNKTIGNENSTVHFTINGNAQQQIPEFFPHNILLLTILVATVILVYKKHTQNHPFLPKSTHLNPNKPMT